VQEYTVAGFADDWAWLCDQLGVVTPVVVGHSLGPTDDARPQGAAHRRLSSLPQHVTLSAWEQHLLVWDGEEAAAACRVPALLISSGTPLSDISRFQELTPQLATGQTVGAGHFITLFVPEQVNAMIEQFLAISLPAPA
jgi:pimeloyl-ACP methyl ester carboxylesterase